MTDIVIYLSVVLGIVISVMLPILKQSIPKPRGGVASIGGFLQRLFQAAKPYIALTLFSLIVGLLLVAIEGDKLNNWQTALLAGYVWDSTIQSTVNKLTG